MNIENIYILFWLYSILGWIMETTYISLLSKKFINRGFFIGPYCPIYGAGAIILLILNIPSYYNPIIISIISIFVCSVLEYLTSYFLELIYHVRWWDYSENFFNINGRICLFNSICFGFLGMIMICYLNPFFINQIMVLNSNLKIVIIVALLIVTTIDILFTFNAMYDIRKSITNLKDKTLTTLFKKDNTEEVSKKVKSILKEKSFIHKHLSSAYSNLKVYRDSFFKKSEDLLKYKILQKIETMYVVVLIISIVIGLIIGNVINNNSLAVVICFILGLVVAKIINKGKYGK